jgi:hypothetical protein
MGVHWHTILAGLFGWPGTWGTGGNLVAWVLCGTLGFGWLHAKQKARHIQLLAQSAQHHKDALALAEKQHQEAMAQAGRHQQELLDRADAHHEALKAHITAAVADAQVSGGAGANPANQGFAADQPQADPAGTPAGERVVPPPATSRKPSAPPASRRNQPRRM